MSYCNLKYYSISVSGTARLRAVVIEAGFLLCHSGLCLFFAHVISLDHVVLKAEWMLNAMMYGCMYTHQWLNEVISGY